MTPSLNPNLGVLSSSPELSFKLLLESSPLITPLFLLLGEFCLQFDNLHLSRCLDRFQILLSFLERVSDVLRVVVDRTAQHAPVDLLDSRQEELGSELLHHDLPEFVGVLIHLMDSLEDGWQRHLDEDVVVVLHSLVQGQLPHQVGNVFSMAQFPLLCLSLDFVDLIVKDVLNLLRYVV